MRSPPEPRVYRGALLGLGGIARSAHLPAFRSRAVRDRLKIVAAVDASPSVEPVDGIPLLPSRSRLADVGAPLDFVDICTPPASHLELALWALGQGYHVLCEKPVAVTRGEAETLAIAARRARRVVMPCHQYRYNPAWRTLQQWLAEGAIGRWHLAEFHVYRLEADRGTATDSVPWRGRRDAGRGGVLLDHGTHLIYELLDVAGPPIAVRTWTGRLRHGGYDVEDTAQLLFEYPDRLAVMFLTWAARKRETRVRFIGERGTIEWAGGILTREVDGKVETFDYSTQLDKASYAGWFAELFGRFAAAIDDGDGDSHLEDIARVAVVLEAAYR